MYIICLHEETFLLLFFISLFISFMIYRKKNRIFRYWVLGTFILYSFFVINLVILPITIYSKETLEHIYAEFEGQITYIQMIPFKTILNTFQTSGWKRQVWGNILLLYPLPVFIEIMSNFKISVKKVFAIGFCVSFSLELCQLIISLLTHFPSRICDVDDLLLNTFGIFLGILTTAAIKRSRFLNSLVQKFALKSREQEKKNT